MKRKPNQLRSQVERYLLEVVPARERKNRHRALLNFTSKIHPEILEIDKEKMLNCIDLFLNVDRYIRLVQKENESLQGEDYKDKRQVEEEKMVELGYGNLPYKLSDN